jgi:hypothetical protein
MSRNARVVVALLIVALALSACAPGENPAVGLVDGGAGFWLGLWHGIIAPLTFLISLFTDEVNVYEVANSGNWYDFGFVLGAGILFGGRGVGRRRRTKRRPVGD